MMLPYIDPVAFSIGNLQLRWYGLMYLAGFGLGWWLGRWRASRPGSDWRATDVDDLLTCVMIGIILGGRLGYVLFYDLPVYISDPMEILRIWNGGMSFHGGLLGVLGAFWYFARTRHRSFLDISDFVAPLVPQGLFFGRLGNYINGELWGKVTAGPWGVVFPGAGSLPRHPSQLYEALLEGLVLFALVWIYSLKPRKRGAVSGLFALGYGLFRFIVEFVRVPDAQLGYLAFGWLTMGQVLCLPLMAVGLWLLCRQAPVMQQGMHVVLDRPGTKKPDGRNNKKRKPKK
ncbi:MULTISPECIES: prolipoprotein diacylglyceryl transferase [Desulfovibrio]|uniref:Phosphatidylglycerol--prolipoprotein diacylglyceryl transferase n=3 Tax=Desulfovibrio TaxID=872 RepID=A0AA94L317_DESDE|nr:MULTISPECIES: prolipoprotein diacylglyceryl transferase [Desulfovibrio]ATD82003.1 prolipoprotein diacylglyceryl transferase [Desulfovibrio sp. G11]MDY0204060.1 prolipoprotein diacylglyceryl transferase [Desulfovibrio desulfuricans]SFW65383.1 phosphatidylglycerol:prolipoprotein diacylglycerol transferase [Desulfovibrio desulfuricans]SPD34752.1 Prolipoprotein diacylglyceryl transferase [Desulfovibrio sp. G11]